MYHASVGRYNADGNAAVNPWSVDAIYRVFQTVSWGSSLGDKLRIGAYYGLRILSGALRRDHDLIGGMYPEYWLGDVTLNSPIGRFFCRAGTIDFDIVNPNYEAAEVEAFQRQIAQLPAAEAVCLDVGAHIGKFSVLAGRLMGGGGQVFAFEPEPRNFATLVRNVELNGLTNVHPINAACGIRDGVQYLSRSTTNIGAHTLLNRQGAERIPVRVRSLDSFASEMKLGRVGVMKLDVEYMEAEVLRGAKSILELNPGITVFFEDTDSSGSAPSILFLRSLGFDPVRLAKNTYAAARPG